LPYPARPKPGNTFFIKRIGGTTYHVGVCFNSAGTETMQDKILRLAKNDLNFSPICATINLLQTGRLLEGGSLA